MGRGSALEDCRNFLHSCPLRQLKEDQQRALLRREFELQSLGLQRRLEQKFWSQEKNMLVQESQQFKHNFLLLFMKLRWFLKRWRQGKVLPSEGDDFLEVWLPWDWDWGGRGPGEIGGEGYLAGVDTALRLKFEPSACRLPSQHLFVGNQLFTGRCGRAWGSHGEEDKLGPHLTRRKTLWGLVGLLGAGGSLTPL